MAFEVKNSDAVMSEINMTPLVDVMLVLLIIFIITIPVVQHAVKVELPRERSVKNQAPLESLQLSVDAHGRFFLGKQPIADDGLQGVLQEHASNNPQPQLFIRGDKDVAYGKVAHAISAAQRAGLMKIGFVINGLQP